MKSHQNQASFDVAHLVAPAPFGGKETVIQMLALAQHRRGWRVAVVAVTEPTGEPQPSLDRIEAEGVRVVRIEIAPRRYVQEYGELRRTLRALRPSLAHSHGYRADVVGGMTAMRLGIPLVSTVHGFTGGDARNRLYEFLQVWLYRHCGATVAVSPAMIPRLRNAGVPSERIWVIPNAWGGGHPFYPRAEARQRLNLPEAGKVLGWVGRMNPPKGPDILVRAMSHLTEFPLTACVIGTGPQEAEIRRMADGLGVGDRIVWVGQVEAAGRYFRAFDALAVTSRTEGIPIVILEAMAAEIPVVATSVGGVPLLLNGGRAGVLVTPGDPEAVARGARALLERPEVSEMFVREGRRQLEDGFGAEQWVDRYEAVYRAVGRR